MSATDTTYTAYVSPNADQVEVVVTFSVPAGISGPCETFTFDREASMREVVAELGHRGFIAPALEDWKTSVHYDGLSLSAEVTR